MLADHGVDDVHIIIATSLHRRMHDWEDQAHGRRQGLERLLARSALQPRRLRSRRHGRARQDARTASSSRPTGAPPRATSSSTSTSTSCRWTAATSRSASGCAATRALKAHHTPKAIVDSELVHGSAEVDLAHSVERIGARLRRAHEGLPHRDRAQQPHVRRAAVVPDEERGRLHRDRSPEVPGDEVDARQDCRARCAARSSCACRRPTS